MQLGEPLCVAMRAFLLLVFLAGARSAGALTVPEESGQVVLVTAPGWSATSATLQRWTRADRTASWTRVGRPMAAQWGERGIGWALEAPAEAAGPRKREGDRRAPAGVFPLLSAFGGQRPAGCRLPWRTITPTLHAVDDPASRFYNRLADTATVRADWRSSEHMTAIPDYALGIVVGHNSRAVRGAGSCIFIHLWRGARRGTAGCTILREADLLTLVRWLDPARHPRLIQLPRDVAARELAGF